MAILLDLMAVGILVSMVLYGRKKGLVLAVAGIVVTILSIIIAWAIAGAFSPALEGFLEENVGGAINDALDKIVAEGGDMLPDFTSPNGDALAQATGQVFDTLGFSAKTDNPFVNAVIRKATEMGGSLKAALTSTICGAIAFAGLFVFGFILVRAVLEIGVHFVDKVVKLPILKRFNKIGGMAVGFVQGALILFVIGWGLQFAGMLVTSADISQTYIFSHFTGAGFTNMLNKLLASKL
ncbi:MAG: CvpA family protein [Oscillospiraceae bacterium]|nr:CvpA family protein [Oscillospiraceae bacterium]